MQDNEAKEEEEVGESSLMTHNSSCVIPPTWVISYSKGTPMHPGFPWSQE